MSASKKSSSKHRSSQRGEVVDAGKQQHQQQQRHREKRDRVSSPMSAGGGGGDGTRNNNGNYNGTSSRSNTPLHSPSSPNNNTDTSDFNTSYNTDTDTDDNFSPDREQQQYHQRTKSPTAQSVSSRTAASASVRSSRIIHDESVQLDLPMADLMAYLQVVANNSSNLPLTRRDDPELGRTVSSLTSEEYALKCAAFIPANVRILGGMYGKYGSVWDLPTSEVSSFLF